MWRRLLGIAIVTWGVAAAAYLTWCQHRISFTVLMADRAWPRPWPYPDRWLSRWYDQLDADNPVPPGFIKMEGEWYRLRGRVRAYTISAFALVAAGVAALLWPHGKQPHQRFSIRRGVSIGLVIGATWAAVVSHLTDETPPSMWLSLTAHALGFALAGAAIGAVRRYPEFVGLCAGLFAIVVFAGASSLEVDEIRNASIDYKVTSWSHLRTALGVEWDLAWAATIGVPGLLWGPVIGALYRLCSPATNSKPNPGDDLIYG